ncbi:restriction endonuclease subunit S [Verrucomicrobia bacterium S94]|nr:restriction endonuclease subunit S [Verrucomicrobia bacterium S94]
MEYKPSGVEWLDKVPEGWVIGAIKRTANLQAGFAFQSKDFSTSSGIPIVRMNNLSKGLLNLDSPVRVSDKLIRPEFYLNDKDIVLGMSGSIENIARVQKFDLPCALNQRVGRFFVHTIDADFLWYIIQSREYKEQVFLSATGTAQLNISSEQIESCVITWPELLSEQRAIASFLDRETEKIDRMIGKQERMIELLKEKRQAVISHAVTKGLNPNVPMKDSGIEWLGEIPEHWDIRTISRSTTKITNGYVGPTRGILFENGVPYIQATHIKKGVVNFDDAYFVRKEWSNAHSKSILREGDVLIVQTGAGTGDVGLVSNNEEGYNCHALIILAPRKGVISGGFLSEVLQSHYGYSKLYSIRTGGMHPHLNCSEVQYVKVPVPPRYEQDAIMEFIKAETSKLDRLGAKAKQAIELMKERRTALISAAVTGKIDVRDEAECVNCEYDMDGEPALLAAEAQAEYRTGSKD